MKLSLEVKPLSGVLEWILEWNETTVGVIVALLGQDFGSDCTNSLTMFTFTVHVVLDSRCSFCHAAHMLQMFSKSIDKCRYFK